MMEFNGIYTPDITPHFDDFSIDEAGFARMINHLIDEGVHGIIIAGTTGELRPIHGRAPKAVGTWH